MSARLSTRDSSAYSSARRGLLNMAKRLRYFLKEIQAGNQFPDEALHTEIAAAGDAIDQAENNIASIVVNVEQAIARTHLTAPNVPVVNLSGQIFGLRNAAEETAATAEAQFNAGSLPALEIDTLALRLIWAMSAFRDQVWAHRLTPDPMRGEIDTLYLQALIKAFDVAGGPNAN